MKTDTPVRGMIVCANDSGEYVEKADYDRLIRILAAAELATWEHCTCGGKDADNPSACPACRIYHSIEDAKLLNAPIAPLGNPR